MKKNKLSYNLETLFIPFVVILSVLLIVLMILYGNEYYKNKELNDKIERLNFENSELRTDNDSESNNENLYYIYDCSFTKTYNIVNLLDGYISEVPEYSYIVVDEYQSHYAQTIRIPSVFKKDLREQEYYEITYTLKGKTNQVINDMEFINDNISLGENYNFNITIEIQKTNRLGNDQINEPICSYK